MRAGVVCARCWFAGLLGGMSTGAPSCYGKTVFNWRFCPPENTPFAPSTRTYVWWPRPNAQLFCAMSRHAPTEHAQNAPSTRKLASWRTCFVNGGHFSGHWVYPGNTIFELFNWTLCYGNHSESYKCKMNLIYS